jgi:hypothetical protein
MPTYRRPRAPLESVLQIDASGYGFDTTPDPVPVWAEPMNVLPMLGFRWGARFVSPAVVARFPALRLKHSRPNGVWIEAITLDQNANVAIFNSTVVMANAAAVGGAMFTFDQPPGTLPANVSVEVGDLAVSTADYAFVPAQSNLIERIGARLWLPPTQDSTEFYPRLVVMGTTVNTVLSGNVSLSFGP